MAKKTVLSVAVAFALANLGSTQGVAAQGPTQVARVPADQIGEHGPLSDYASGPIELVGKTDLSSPGSGGKPLGNNGAVALIGDCAFVSRWHDYPTASASPSHAPIQIVNVGDPANPSVIGSVPGSAVTNAVAREIRAIDLPGFKLLTVLTFSKFTDEGATAKGKNAFYFYGFPSGDCANPVLVGEFDSYALRAHEFFQWLDPNPAHNVNGHPRVLEFVTTPLGGADMFVLDASKPEAAQIISAWNGGQPLASGQEANLAAQSPAGAGRYAHSISISPDGTQGYVSHWDGGFFTMDTSDFAAGLATPVVKPLGGQSVPLTSATGTPGNTHSAVSLPGTNNVVVGGEVYVTTGGCPFEYMRVIDRGTLTSAPHQISSFGLPENSANCSGKFANDRNASGMVIDGTFSMHNQTVTEHYVLTSWYGGGLRIIDLSNPASPDEVAFFVPKPVDQIASTPETTAPIYGATPQIEDDWWVSMWSYPVIRDGLIYVTDIRSGLYILRATAGSDLAAELNGIGFLEGNSNLGDLS